ncbi:MAG: acetyl-CoA decarbonylase/synthase complex subunit gamma [Candidatus Omnitrophica bacterium CG11_big_fil_rev_8_21_14_0_20_42_13]|uniref:Acetyl-CoA decarbonylase/synthase complex subunit gamma n=1 Tax=Candidatus Ghiorseimicrobium undicola TaxID=1974746 RepID=A0A2H0M249_9BACT|nr:MAG: acetyl-CoA decarbonylase/synthase complex subunit gamma [Candidatus Omnitrophica bacterium CG11_big_fil_rev_8_21_14_0_20_42_13]
MAFSGLDIYKLLPKTNCRKCGFPTCLAFAMQLAKKAVSVEKCPEITAAAKAALEASAQPPIKLITVGEGEQKLEIGNENVLFRHEEKFFHPAGVGIIINDAASDEEIKNRVEHVNKLSFERIGQQISVNLIAVRQAGSDKARFEAVVKKVAELTKLGIVLISADAASLKAAAAHIAKRKPIIHAANKENYQELAAAAKELSLPLVVKADTLEELSELIPAVNSAGANDLILQTGDKPVNKKIWDLTQIRRMPLKKNNRVFGYPSLTVIKSNDTYEQVIEACDYILKYTGIVLLEGFEAYQILPILTLRQNIYTDPQKPLQVEPKAYPIGQVNENSPVLITTNFSLSYYTVLGEVEASKIPAFLISVDTEGMSVLTAWAAEKFTPDKINESIKKFGIPEKVKHKNIVIPGYVAVMSGDLEEKSGYRIIVGPREAAGIPSFLKNIQKAG